jgi:hypothetical protein
MYLFFVWPYAIARMVEDTYKTIALLVIFAVTSFVELVALLAFFRGYHQFLGSGFGARCSWPFPSPICLYPIAILGLSASLAFLGYRNCKLYPIMSVIGIALSLGCVAFTFTRGGYISAAGVLCIFAYLKRTHRALLLIAAGVFILGALFVRGSDGGMNDASVVNRIIIWRTVLSEPGTYSWMGRGHESFLHSSVRQQILDRFGSAPYEPNNLLLSVLLDWGIMGITIFAAGIGWSLVPLYKSLRSQSGPLPEVFFSSCAVIGFLVAGLFDTPVSGQLLRCSATVGLLAAVGLAVPKGTNRLGKITDAA